VSNKRILLAFITIVAVAGIVFSSCKKLNESTELGGDLIPPVDNITTFDTLIDVQAFNDTFGLANDSSRLGKDGEYFLGLINNDPFFGKTDARMFFDMKPLQYGTYPFSRRDSVKIDSVVLVLSYNGTFGDTNTAQTIKVYEIDNALNTGFKGDSAYLIRQEPVTYSTFFPLSSPGQIFFPRNLNDSVKAFRDSFAINQLRIKLDTVFGRRFFIYDTATVYKNDSTYRSRFKGFAIRSEGAGNGIMSFNLASANTKLAFYYKHPKVGGGGDTTNVTYFFFNPTLGSSSLSASANYVKRDYNGGQILSSLTNPSTTADQILYIQNTPGTFATVKVPGLVGLSNRVIHRAELIAEQLYDQATDSTFFAPEYLYLDAFDPTITSSNKYRTIPYDVVFNQAGSLNLDAYGVAPIFATDGGGNRVRTWRFNISRYVQNYLTGKQTLYDLRLFSPYQVFERYGIPPNGDGFANFGLNTGIARGRIRLVGTSGTGDTNPRRLRLRLIYSKL
jgi:hypothetical protein